MDSTFSGDNTTDSGHGSNDGESEAPKSPSHATHPPSSPHQGTYSQWLFTNDLLIVIIDMGGLHIDEKFND